MVPTSLANSVNQEASSYALWIQHSHPQGLCETVDVRASSTSDVSLFPTGQNAVYADPTTPELSVQLLVSGIVGQIEGDAGFSRIDTSTTTWDFGGRPENSSIDHGDDHGGEGNFELLICSAPWDRVPSSVENVLPAPQNQSGHVHAQLNFGADVATVLETLWGQMVANDRSSRLVVDTLVNQLLQNLVDLSGRQIPGPGQGSRLSIRQFSDVLDYMVAHLGDVVDLETLASVAGISRFHFSRLFSAKTGQSPTRFLRQLRIEKASQDLIDCPQTSIAEIAVNCGFCDQAHLTRIFKLETGMTPAKYRRLKCGRGTERDQ